MLWRVSGITAFTGGSHTSSFCTGGWFEGKLQPKVHSTCGGKWCSNGMLGLRQRGALCSPASLAFPIRWHILGCGRCALSITHLIMVFTAALVANRCTPLQVALHGMSGWIAHLSVQLPPLLPRLLARRQRPRRRSVSARRSCCSRRRTRGLRRRRVSALALVRFEGLCSRFSRQVGQVGKGSVS